MTMKKPIAALAVALIGLAAAESSAFAHGKGSTFSANGGSHDRGGNGGAIMHAGKAPGGTHASATAAATITATMRAAAATDFSEPASPGRRDSFRGATKKGRGEPAASAPCPATTSMLSEARPCSQCNSRKRRG
jgi:hypothetical protein